MLKFRLHVDGQPDEWVYINPEHIVTVRDITNHDYSASPPKTTSWVKIVTVREDLAVREPIDEVMKRLDFYFASQVEMMMVEQGRPM